MNLAPVVAALALVFLPLVDARAQAPKPGAAPVAAVQKRLEGARADLAKAVKQIEKDPPSTADLDAAHAAVGALKEAIDAAAPSESEDLELAKTVLAARKELRTQREYVDQRRANVHIHEYRRKLDAALVSAKARAAELDGKSPDAKDFDDARAAVAALKKLAAEARPFGKQDPKFAAFLGEVDAAVAKHEKAIDDRWAALAADKQSGLLAEARQALTAAMGALNKGATDAQFDAAERAAAALSKRLDEGKPLEPRDKGYRADAEKARGELAQSKKKMEELFSASALERLKAEIAPAHKDLTGALATLRGKKPSEDQLAEARTAAIVVRKLLEKLQPKAEHSQAFGQYLNEVKASLVQVEVELQQRSLSSARAEVMQALRNIEKRTATDEQFDELETALTVLQKTLEPVHKKDPALAKPAADAQALLRDARATMAKRRVEVDVQRQRAKVQETKASTENTVKAIQQPNAGDEQLQAAEAAVKQLRAVLEEGAPFTKKDRDYATYDKEVKDRLNELSGRIASRRIQLAAGAARARLNERTAEAKAKLETAKKPESTDADVEAAAKAVAALGEAVEAGKPLEKQDGGYAAHADRVKNELPRHQEALDLAKLARTLRKQTGEELAAARSMAEAAGASPELRKQKELYEKAIARFRSCEGDGATLLKESPVLLKVPVLVDGRPSTPREVIGFCVEGAKAAEPLLRKATALAAFEYGPKKSFEQAARARSDRAEALRLLGECVVEGKIAQHKYPELKEEKLDVAGAPRTLAEVVDECGKQRKALQGK